VIETTTDGWDIYDIVAPLVTRAVVAHAGAVRQIAEARVKTDKDDFKRLIRLLIADIVPEVWVPPVLVRELRGLILSRQRLVKTGTMIRNRLHSLLHCHNLLLPEDGFASKDLVGSASEDQCAGEDPNPNGNSHARTNREEQNRNRQ
jgi:hypothetical protein